MPTVGILGGGQLAMMLAEAAQKLNIETLCIDPNAKASAHHVSNMLAGDIELEQTRYDFLSKVDVVTLENENIPIHVADHIAEVKPLRPGHSALRAAQDRYFEKTLFNTLDIPTPHFFCLESSDDLNKAIETLGFPFIIKQRTHGYDGKGQALIRDHQQATTAFNQLRERPLIAEQFIHFEDEVSLIAARNPSKQCVFYPLTHNTHREGILRVSRAPYQHHDLMQKAQALVSKILEHLNYVGVLAVEFFVKDQQLIANEMAPRVHNSGHWTIEGAKTSQFENHIRAVLDMPLSDASAIGNSVMINCIGEHPNLETIAACPHAHYHDYFKVARKNRKLAHITVHGEQEQEFQQELQQLGV